MLLGWRPFWGCARPTQPYIPSANACNVLIRDLTFDDNKLNEVTVELLLVIILARPGPCHSRPSLGLDDPGIGPAIDGIRKCKGNTS
uniref:Uncharacterized protein n=1 Tax=Amphimedon queenslandica TaxID=400682 RepID=A0A1X7TET1_AMPQE